MENKIGLEISDFYNLFSKKLTGSGNYVSSIEIKIQEGINVFPMSNVKLTSGTYLIQLITENQTPIVYRHVVR